MVPERTLCSACGFSSEAAARFCGGCGRPLTRDVSGSRRLFVGGAPPPHLAQRILASRDAIEGERKLVTVMFVDILGSTELIVDRDPEQAQAILDTLLREMITAVHRYEGTVSQVLGDGLMAIFGAPIAHEDHAVRAACAALAIQDAVRNARNSVWQSLGLHAQVRIGLNSGLVVINAIENDLSIDYRAVGATTHLASRMEQIAPAGSIRLTRDTLRLAEGLIDAEPLGSIAIKGIAQPVEVYELRRMTPGGTRFRSRVTRGLTPMIGRSEELALLAQVLGEAAQGKARAAVLHGEPGVGKSRLCYEVTRAGAAQAFYVLESATTSYSRNTPYSAILGLLEHYFGITGVEKAEALRQPMLQDTPGAVPIAAEHLAILRELLDVTGDNTLWQSLDPIQWRQRVFAAVRAIIKELCERQPVILIWEDLHWLDAESLEFVEGLLRDPPGGALLMLLTSREALHGPLPEDVVSRQLKPLAPELADRMLRNLIGDAPELARLRALLAERTYGNPFFVEETVRALIDSGVLIGTPGNYVLREPEPVLDIPATAAALIAARIDALAPQAKALMQTAAVIGDEMAIDVLRRASGLDEAAFGAGLAASVDSGLMYELQHFPSTRCGFRHALNQEVAYGSLLGAQRKILHGRALEALEEVYRERIAEHVERLAEHSFRAEHWEKSVRYHIMAASRAASRFANHEALQILDRGLEVVEHLAPGRARSEAAIDLRLAGLAALLPLGEYERILSTLLEAETIAASTADARRLAAVHSQISAALWMAGHHERARDSAARALAIAKEQNQFGLRLSACFSLAMAHHALGNLEQCRDLTLGLIAELGGELERKRFGWAGFPSVLCRVFLGSSLHFMGHFEEAGRCLERGIALSDATGHPYSRALVRHELGVSQLMQGQPLAAVRTLQEAIAIAREGQVRTMYAPISGWLGAALADAGRVEEAIDTLEQMVDAGMTRVAGHYAHFYMLNGLASAYARAGRYGEALSSAEEAVERTQTNREFVHHGLALLRFAGIQAERGAAFFDEAESLYREALERARAHRMRPLAAACHEGLGRLHAQRARKSEAQEELRAASALFAEIGLADRSKSVQDAARLLA